MCAIFHSSSRTRKCSYYSMYCSSSMLCCSKCLILILQEWLVFYCRSCHREQNKALEANIYSNPERSTLIFNIILSIKLQTQALPLQKPVCAVRVSWLPSTRRTCVVVVVCFCLLPVLFCTDETKHLALRRRLSYTSARFPR